MKKLQDLPWHYINKPSIFGDHSVIGGPRSHEGLGTVIFRGHDETTAKAIAALGGWEDDTSTEIEDNEELHDVIGFLRNDFFEGGDWWVDIENDAVRTACQSLDQLRKEIIVLAAAEAVENEIDSR